MGEREVIEAAKREANARLLSQFRGRVEASSELHKSTVVPHDERRPDGKLRIHKQGLDPDEKQRVTAEGAAEIRRAMGGGA